MDHDSVPFDVDGPTSHRIADVRAAYEKFARRGLDVMSEKIASEPAYDSNEQGHFAWDVSLLIRAACLTWRVTGDPAHLRQAATWAQHMVERTDQALGRKNWRKSTVPAWSAGPRYTAGTAAIGTIGGATISLQAASERVVIERPTDTTAIIHSIRDDGRTWSSPEGSLLPHDADYLPDLLARRSSIHSVLMRGLPAPIDLTFLSAGEFEVRHQYGAHLVHTGLIARSLLAAAEAIEAAGPETVSTGIAADDLYEAARNALFLHDDEIRTRSGQAWYITLEDFPSRRLGLEVPHNHVVDAATSFLILGRRDKDKGLLGLGASLTRRFLGEIDAYEAGELRHPWYYYPVDSDIFFGVTRDEPMAERCISPVQRGEDASHATMRVRALTEWKAMDSRLIPDRTLSTAALAFRRFYLGTKHGISSIKWLPGDNNDAPKFGQADTYSGAWGSLAPWDSTIKRRVNSLAFRHPPEAIFGATVLSAAEILAMNTGGSTYAASDRSAPA
ncbi:hypothetical protein [Brachybacterium sp. GCM10030252]|uniref:hypothetical protein n=1 Tax=Brachybacterium sp. GCM10030252 TaxID=3273380 RepID=UPI00361A4AE2